MRKYFANPTSHYNGIVTTRVVKVGQISMLQYFILVLLNIFRYTDKFAYYISNQTKSFH